MTPFAFASKARNLVAVLMSAAAVLAIVAYLTAPVAADPLIVSSYTASRHPVVSGIVKAHSKAEMSKTRITLVFRDAKGRVIATVHPSIDRHGRWRTAIPQGAARVTVSIRDGGRVTSLTEPIRPGHSLKLTAVLPGNRTGLLPGLFPY